MSDSGVEGSLGHKGRGSTVKIKSKCSCGKEGTAEGETVRDREEVATQYGRIISLF